MTYNPVALEPPKLTVAVNRKITRNNCLKAAAQPHIIFIVAENEYKSATKMSNGQARSGGTAARSSCPISVTLSAADIPGADLSEPSQALQELFLGISNAEVPTAQLEL